MTKIRIVLGSVLAIASLLAGGAVSAHHSTAHRQHTLAGPIECCDSANI